MHASYLGNVDWDRNWEPVVSSNDEESNQDTDDDNEDDELEDEDYEDEDDAKMSLPPRVSTVASPIGLPPSPHPPPIRTGTFLLSAA
jgi:hypothetical protein